MEIGDVVECYIPISENDIETVNTNWWFEEILHVLRPEKLGEIEYREWAVKERGVGNMFWEPTPYIIRDFCIMKNGNLGIKVEGYSALYNINNFRLFDLDLL